MPQPGIREILARRGLLSGPALERAQRLEAESGERIDRIAAKLGLVSDRDLVSAYAGMLGTAAVSASEFPVAPVAPDRIGRAFVRRARVVPLSADDATLTVAMADPLDDAATRALEFALGLTVCRRPALPADIDAAIERLYGDGRGSFERIAEAAGERDSDGKEEDLERLRDLASEAPVIRLVNTLIARGVEMGASDVHLESADAALRVRYRVDGVLRDGEPPPARLRGAVISRIKIMAKLNVAERRLAQDGRIRLAVRGKEVDFRVSTIPAIHGECVVLRILDRGALRLDFATLGFDDDLLAPFQAQLSRPHGIVLVTGPTGSGKTTTLYTALKGLNRPDRKILTAEDLVEYMLEGISQLQVKPEIGLTFATALRSFLRQDPDIMMIGEIRDPETAQIAVQAALTGHLVLSTVHTNDAASAITRLLDMGIEDYLLTSTINGILAQRLVRRLCPTCRIPFPAPAPMATRLGIEPGTVLHRAKGCPACNDTGYAGRSMIVEFLVPTDPIRELVLRHAPAREIAAEAMRSGMRTMHAHGLRKVLAGQTTLEEVVRVTQDA